MTIERQPLLAKDHDADAAPGCGRDFLWSAKTTYLLWNAAQAAFTYYLPVLYQDTIHFSKFQIGILQALPCICTIVGPPFWCALADTYRRHRSTLNLCILLGAVLVYAAFRSRSFAATLVLVVGGNFVMAPIPPLLDHAVLDVLRKYGGEYGKQRLFASLGYGLGAYTAGLAVFVGGIAWAFNLSFLFSLASMVVLRYLPVIQHPQHGSQRLASSEPPHEASFLDAMRIVAKKTDVLVLLLVVFLMSLMYGVLTSFLTLNLYELSGQNAQIIGVAILCETLSEMPAFYFAQRLIDSLGVVRVMLLALGAYTVRISYYAFMTNAWTAIPFEFLHGLTYGITWAVATEYLYASAPRGFEGTMVGLLGSVQEGAGRGAGTLLGGYLYDHYGAQTMWLVTGGLGVPLALLGVAAFASLQHQEGTTERWEDPTTTEP